MKKAAKKTTKKSAKGTKPTKKVAKKAAKSTALTKKEDNKLSVAISNFSEDTRGAAKFIVERASMLAKGTVKVLWEIGNCLNNVSEEKDIPKEDVFEEIEEHLAGLVFMNLSKPQLYVYCKFAETYKDFAHIESLLSAAKKAKRSIDWTHFKLLSTVKDDKDRQELEKMVLTEGLPVRKLQSAIEDKVGKTATKLTKEGRKKPGRPPLRPQTWQSVPKLCHKECDRFIDRALIWDEVFFDELEKLSAEDITDEVFASAQQVHDDIDVVYDKARDLRERATAIWDRVCEEYNSRLEQAPEAEAEEEDDSETLSESAVRPKKTSKKKKRPKKKIAVTEEVEEAEDFAEVEE